MSFLTAGTIGFSEPERLTQRKSKRLIEGFVCNPLLFACNGVIVAVSLKFCNVLYCIAQRTLM